MFVRLVQAEVADDLQYCAGVSEEENRFGVFFVAANGLKEHFKNTNIFKKCHIVKIY